jgi:hypothetical protein
MSEIATTYQELLDSIPALQHLAALEMKAVTSLKLARLITAVDAETALFWKKHAELAERCGGMLNEEGTNYIIPKDGSETYTAEFTEMLAAEIALSVAKLSVTMLDGVSLTPLQMMRLEIYFED